MRWDTSEFIRTEETSLKCITVSLFTALEIHRSGFRRLGARDAARAEARPIVAASGGAANVSCRSGREPAGRERAAHLQNSRAFGVHCPNPLATMLPITVQT